MDRLTSLRVFTRVVEAGSFTAAAERLGLSRAAVSKAVIELEDALGARLIERTTRRLRVNEVGAAFYERCSRILSDLEEAELSVGRLHGQPRGLLRVNAPMSFGILHLQPAISAFLARYPELQISLTLNDRFVDLIDEGYDIAVRITRPADSSLIARRIAPARRALYAAPGYLRDRGVPETPAELAGHRCLIYGARPGGEDWLLSGADGEHRVRVSGPLAVNNGDVLCGAARDGLGIALLPTFIAGPDLSAGCLQRVLPGYAPEEISVYAVYPPNRHLSAKVRVFIDALVERFGRQPHWDQGI